MKKESLLFPLLLLISINTNGQCNELDQALVYIKSTLVSDLFYYSFWEPTDENKSFVELLEKEGVDIEVSNSKEEIREPIIWLMKERIQFDTKLFEDLHRSSETDKCVKTIYEQEVGRRNDANYLIFTSNICNKQLLIKVLHNRDPGLNMKGGKTEYEKWSRMNGGMSYLFSFDENTCIIHVQKKPINYG